MSALGLHSVVNSIIIHTYFQLVIWASLFERQKLSGLAFILLFGNDPLINPAARFLKCVWPFYDIAK